jgi:hypothetical protein
MTHLRFYAKKKPNKMAENYYRREDGTFAYFFEKGVCVDWCRFLVLVSVQCWFRNRNRFGFSFFFFFFSVSASVLALVLVSMLVLFLVFGFGFGFLFLDFGFGIRFRFSFWFWFRFWVLDLAFELDLVPYLLDTTNALFSSVGFVPEDTVYDTRMLYNRKRMLKMYRVWIQGRFRKPATARMNTNNNNNNNENDNNS